MDLVTLGVSWRARGCSAPALVCGPGKQSPGPSVAPALRLLGGDSPSRLSGCRESGTMGSGAQ